MSESERTRVFTSYMIRFRILFTTIHPHKLAKFLRGLQTLFDVTFLPGGHAVVRGNYLVAVLHYEVNMHVIAHYVTYQDANILMPIIPPNPNFDLVTNIDGEIVSDFDGQKLEIKVHFTNANIQGRVAITLDTKEYSKQATKELFDFLKLCRENDIQFAFDLLRPM